jgi:RepB DNA-primase from phage plasmid
VTPSEIAAEFLHAFILDGEGVTFQTFPDPDELKGNKSLTHVRNAHPETLNHTLGAFEKLNEKRAGIFWTVNQTDLTGRTKDKIIRVRAVFVDLDGAPLAPSVTVESSPGRFHAYWIVTDVPLEDFTPVQKALAARFDGDVTVCDLPRVMRLPGFAHHKGEPFVTRVLEMHPERVYTRSELLEAFPEIRDALEATKQPKRRDAEATHATGTPDVHRKYALTALENEVLSVLATQEGSRNDALNKAAFALGQLVGADALSESTARGSLEDAAQQIGLSESEARATIKSGLDAGKLEPRDLSEVGKKSGVQMVRADGEKAAPKEEPRESQADRLVKLAEDAMLWHTQDGEAFADLTVNHHRETHAVRSKAFRQWLAFAFYQDEGKAAGSQALQDALNTLEGKARFEGDEHEAFVRIAHANIGGEDRTYFDLGREDWKAVEITRDGWQLVQHPPVRFRRPRSLRPLPEPVPDGSINELKAVLNVAQNSWVLLVAWLVACFSRGPFPVLLFVAEAGSGKTTTAERVRALIDPAKGGLRAEPREVRDLMIAASNAWIPAFDNLSSVPVWLSDALCRLATGGGFATRELYSNDEETILDVTRPALLTGIEDLATRGDLLDRALIIRLEPIRPDKRQTRAELDASFELVHARALGALLTAASRALRDSKTITLASLPRMADFAVWVAAAAPELGFSAEEFIREYELNRADANSTALEASTLAGVLRGWLASPTAKFSGTVGELLHELNSSIADEDAKRSRGWPKTAKALSGALRRIAPNLRGVGLSVEFGRRTERGVLITLEQRPGNATGRSDVQRDRAGQHAKPEHSLNVDVQENPDVQDAALEPEHWNREAQERTANVQAENTVLDGVAEHLNILNVKNTPVLNAPQKVRI